MLWLPIAYKWRPRGLAYHGLRGFLKQRGQVLHLVPPDAIREVADHVLDLHLLIARMEHRGLVHRLSQLTRDLERTALEIDLLLHCSDRTESFLANCWNHKVILERFGVNIPPVLVDRNNRRIAQ